MINKEFSFERSDNLTGLVPERTLPYAGISLINAITTQPESGFVWAFQEESKTAPYDKIYTLPFVSCHPKRQLLHHETQRERRRILLNHEGSLVGLEYAIFLYKDDPEVTPFDVVGEKGHWVDPVIFYQRSKVDGMSSHIIEDLFRIGMFTEITPFYLPYRERNGHVVFSARESILD